MKISWSRTVNTSNTFYFEGFIAEIHDQEIATKFLINKSNKDGNVTPKCNKKCRLCKVNVEDVNYIIIACADTSARYYLPLLHDIIAKAMYKAHLIKEKDEVKFKLTVKAWVCFFNIISSNIGRTP